MEDTKLGADIRGLAWPSTVNKSQGSCFPFNSGNLTISAMEERPCNQVRLRSHVKPNARQLYHTQFYYLSIRW